MLSRHPLVPGTFVTLAPDLGENSIRMGVRP